MGSDLGTLRTLLEDQLQIATTTSSSNPSSTLLNNYINKSIRRIARRDLPRELTPATPTNVNITVDTNTVTIPSTVLVPYLVYYSDSGGSFKRLKYKHLKELINLEATDSFFDTSNSGDPDWYVIRGTSILFNKYFSRTATAAIKLFGVDIPTVLTIDTDTTELPLDYDLLVVYESALLYYIRDDDTANIGAFTQLANKERYQLKFELDNNTENAITMDPDTFTNTTSFSNPSVFFSS